MQLAHTIAVSTGTLLLCDVSPLEAGRCCRADKGVASRRELSGLIFTGVSKTLSLLLERVLAVKLPSEARVCWLCCDVMPASAVSPVQHCTTIRANHKLHRSLVCIRLRQSPFTEVAAVAAKSKLTEVAFDPYSSRMHANNYKWFCENAHASSAFTDAACLYLPNHCPTADLRGDGWSDR